MSNKLKASGSKWCLLPSRVEEVPALCLRSEEEMKQVIATRAAQVICPQVGQGVAIFLDCINCAQSSVPKDTRFGTRITIC